VPVTVLRPSLQELADILEQIFFIACTENLHPHPEDFEAANRDYQAEHGILASSMHELGLNAMRDIRERAQAIAPMLCEALATVGSEGGRSGWRRRGRAARQGRQAGRGSAPQPRRSRRRCRG
jgi:hypothetical protein